MSREEEKVGDCSRSGGWKHYGGQSGGNRYIKSPVKK